MWYCGVAKRAPAVCLLRVVSWLCLSMCETVRVRTGRGAGRSLRVAVALGLAWRPPPPGPSIY